jgi:hypothetical protein
MSVEFASSTVRHRLFGNVGYNIPKVKFLYYVNFVSDKIPSELTKNLNFLVKRVDRINLTFQIEELNQYNKKRLVQTKVNYGPLNMAFHDTVDSTALKMIEAYSRFYYSDFEFKNTKSWIYDLTSAIFEPTGAWGLKALNTPNKQHFFERVEVFEIFDQTYTKVSFIKPLISSVEFQTMDQEISAGNEVILNLQYEGIVVEKISEPVTAAIARQFGLPFVNDRGINTAGTFPSGPVSLFNNVFGQAGQALLSGNLTGAAQQAIGAVTRKSPFLGVLAGTANEILRPTINSFIGGIDFDNFGVTRNLIPSVNIRASAGSIVNDVATGVTRTARRAIDSFLRF